MLVLLEEVSFFFFVHIKYIISLQIICSPFNASCCIFATCLQFTAIYI